LVSVQNFFEELKARVPINSTRSVELEWDGDALWLSNETNGGWTNRVRYERVE